MIRRLVPVLLCLAMPWSPCDTAAREPEDLTLDELVTPAEKDFLLTELARIQPPERLQELSAYGQRQLELGGGFYGMLPDQLIDTDAIPVPRDTDGCLAAALHLAKQRHENLAALKQLNPDYAMTFRNEPLAGFLAGSGSGAGDHDLALTLDMSALTGFMDALAEGEIIAAKAAVLAALPSNQAMLQHRRDLGYVPEPLPDTESLAELMMVAGSADPVDRLWCWINPQNAFDYADLVQHAEGYRSLVRQLESHGGAMIGVALGQIEPYTPEGTRFAATFALTVGWAIRGWATPQMAGLNIEQVKDDWDYLLGTLTEETYHRLQLELMPSAAGAKAREFSDLTTIDTGDSRYDRLYEIITYTVAEGAANLVRGRFASADLGDKAPAGAELMDRFIRQVVIDGDLESADALINEGLQGNGPLYGLGLRLAAAIASHDGTRAVGEMQARGPVAFALRGAELTTDSGESLLTPEVVAALETLDRMIGD